MSNVSVNAIVAEYKRHAKGCRTYSEIRAVSKQFGITVRNGVRYYHNQRCTSE